jgi:hypothetical protein
MKQHTDTSIAELVQDTLLRGLTNIDKLLIREEVKARIYYEYFPISNCFILPIHDFNLSQLRKFDDLTPRYLEKWLGMPQGASWCLIHDRHGIGMKLVAHFCKEARTISLVNICKYGDARVRHALTSKENREESWSRKSSAIKSRGLVADVYIKT